jgi:hypothetical protein
MAMTSNPWDEKFSAPLRVELRRLEFLHAQELERDVNEGAFHRVPDAVVQVIARKAG